MEFKQADIEDPVVREEIKEWAGVINEAVTGTPYVPEPDPWMTGTVEMVENLAGAVDKVKGAFGFRSYEAVSGHCEGCGASITGIRGETTKCPYCGTFHTF